MSIFTDIKKGLYRYEEPNGGWVATVKDAPALLKAAEKARDAGVKDFDVFSPFPIHGLEKAMGLSRSWIPFFSLCGGIFGATFAFASMTLIDVFSWTIIHGGKPAWPWPAYIPITFELMVLFTAFFTLGTTLYLGRLGKISRRPLVNSVTSDGFAIWIGGNLSKQEVENMLQGSAIMIQEVPRK